MNLNWKRIALVIGFLTAVGVFGFLLYYLFLRPAVPSEPVNGNINAIINGGLPGANANANIPIAGNVNGGLTGAGNINIGPPSAPAPGQPAASPTATGGLTQVTALTETPAYSPVIDSNGINALYYDKTTGKFYRLTADGRSVPLSDQIFYDVQNVNWAPSREKAVLEYPDGSKITYDFSTGKQYTLPKHWTDFSFAPSSNQIAFKSLGISDSNRWLAVASADGSQAKKIEPLGNNDKSVMVNWSPNNTIIASFREDASFDQQELYFVGLNGENFKSTTIEGRGLQSKWSAKGDRLLYSVYSSATGYRPTLWIVEAQGDNIGRNRKSLPIATWANKCNFSDNDTVYCAVPQNIAEGAGIFYKDMDTEPSDIYKIDLKTGITTKLATPEGSPLISAVMTTSDGRYLYYTNQTDGKLYKINLK